MISGIFVTGTGTDVGKTVVTTGVLRCLRKRTDAIVMKPAQTGARARGDGRMFAPDVEFVLRACGLSVDEETLAHASPYLFAPACSPHLAARLVGRAIGIDTILASAHWLARRHRPLVVEGAGGVLVPLSDEQSMLDLICALELPVLLVGNSGLGGINHVLLSLQVLRQRNCRIIGVVLNATCAVPDDEIYIHEDNARMIARLGKVAVAHVPYLGDSPCMERLDVALENSNLLHEFLA